MRAAGVAARPANADERLQAIPLRVVAT